MAAGICRCPMPKPTERSVCADCGLFACGYAGRGRAKCSSAICDCFIDQYPDDPMGLHPEAFAVLMPDGTYFTPDPIERKP